MKLHELKCDPEPFEAIRFGSKRAEFRLDDRCFEVGDVVRLRMWSEAERLRHLEIREQLAVKGQEYGSRPQECELLLGYHGEELWLLISDVRRGGKWGIPEGYCMFSFLYLMTGEDSSKLSHPRYYADWGKV